MTTEDTAHGSARQDTAYGSAGHGPDRSGRPGPAKPVAGCSRPRPPSSTRLAITPRR